MKTTRLFALISAIALTGLAFIACEKTEANQPQDTYSEGFALTRAGAIAPNVEVDFLAGQHMLAGKILVTNDADNLYVTYTTTGNWFIKATHLYVGPKALLPANKQGNPQNGQFPYKSTHDPYVTSQTFVIALADLPQCMIVAAHAEVVQVVNGLVVKTETAWGKGENLGKNWSMAFEYCKQTPPPSDDDDEVCYKEETAWSAGTRFVEKGSWGTYTPYDGGTFTVPVYAGQTYYAADAKLEAQENGKVLLTITFNEGWSLQEVAEPVKIQGFATTPPAVNPAPGQFATYKGAEVVVELPAYAFYGIHLDVRKVIPCETE